MSLCEKMRTKHSIKGHLFERAASGQEALEFFHGRFGHCQLHEIRRLGCKVCIGVSETRHTYSCRYDEKLTTMTIIALLCKYTGCCYSYSDQQLFVSLKGIISPK